MDRDLRRLLVIVAACVVFTPLAWRGCAYAVQSTAFVRDFSKERPEAVFRMVFGQGVPEGVTDLRVSGRHYFTKQWVWMRLAGPSAALDTLAALAEGGIRLSGPSAAKALNNDWTGNGRFNAADKHWVAWDEVARIRAPEVYAFSRVPDYSASGQERWQWIGVIILDRPRHVAYIHAGGD